MSVNSTYEIEIAIRLLESIDCPRALSVAIMLRYEHYDDIVSLRAVPDHYEDAAKFFKAYQATRLLQKSKWLPTSFDKQAVALEAFWTAEAQCKSTNELFKALRDGAICIDPALQERLVLAKRKISQMLSKANPYAFLDQCGFGPGSDMSTKQGLTSAYNKLSNSGSVTRECSIFIDFLAQNSALCRIFQWDIKTRHVSVPRVRGNKVAFVPKDCKTDRSIAVEPRWNVFFQKGMGKVLRKVLQRFGQDLDDQVRNQNLAREGSLTGDLATIDLKSASDSVSAELVRYLFPEPWVSILDRLRSKEFRSPKGDWYQANKWSSMGNGYTFELESMIFFALASSVCGPEKVSVYGDDIVIPSRDYSDVVRLLNLCGFTTNDAKSFHVGPFRESCGGDFYNGVQVTPIYWKEPLHVAGTLRLVNQISVLARRSSDGFHRHHSYRRVWHRLVSRLPAEWSRRGPSSIGTVVHDSSGVWAKSNKWGWDGWFIKAMVAKPVKFRFHDYDAAVLAAHFQPSSDGYSVRDRVRYKPGTIFVPVGFEDIGPWV